jgi:hypothetical protein
MSKELYSGIKESNRISLFLFSLMTLLVIIGINIHSYYINNGMNEWLVGILISTVSTITSSGHVLEYRVATRRPLTWGELWAHKQPVVLALVTILLLAVANNTHLIN